MEEETTHVMTSLEYAHVGDLSVQLQGTYPKSISGLSHLALVKVVYPNNDSEEVLMDLFAKQYHVSHGYTLKLNDVSIGTSYLPWRRMFTGDVSLTATLNEVPLKIETATLSLPVMPVIADTCPSCPPVSDLYKIQTMQAPVNPTPQYTERYNERNDAVILAIAALGFLSLGLVGLALFLSRRRGD